MPRSFAEQKQKHFFFLNGSKGKKAKGEWEVEVRREREDGEFWETHRLL